MALYFVRRTVTIAAFVALARAQKTSDVIPDDLQTGFTRGTEVQASYTGEAVNGFLDGTSFERDAVANEPTFALGDSSGISPTTLYTIIMVDTTCPNAMKLHYARANFKNNFDITNIATESDALQAYKAPGSFGETGDNRQYSFLMYTNPSRRQIAQLRLPTEGENFDVKQFQTDNGLPDASAGVGMVVKLGGQADCAGDQANTVPATLPTPRPSPSTAARPTNAGSSTSAALSSTAVSVTSSALLPSVTQSTNATTVVQQSSAGANSTSPTDAPANEDPAATASGDPEAPTGAPSRSTITSTLVLSTILPDITGTASTTGNPAIQTANVGSIVSALRWKEEAGFILAIAGLLLW